MPPRDWKLRVDDIQEAIGRVQEYCTGMTFEAFRADKKTVDAVMRNIGIIGEAASHVPAGVQQRHPEVPWDEMRGIRNRVVHQYFEIDLPILWQTINQDLPPLVPQLHDVLAREP